MEDDAEFLNYTAVVRAALQFVEYMVKVFVRRPTRCSSYPTSAFERPRRNVDLAEFLWPESAGTHARPGLDRADCHAPDDLVFKMA